MHTHTLTNYTPDAHARVWPYSHAQTHLPPAAHPRLTHTTTRAHTTARTHTHSRGHTRRTCVHTHTRTFTQFSLIPDTHTHPDPSVHSPHLLSHTHTPSHPHTHTLVYKGTGGCALAVEGREQHGRAALSAPAPQTAGAMDHRDGTSEVSGLRGHPSVLSRAHPLSSGSPRQPVVWPEAEPGAPNHRRRSPSADASLGSGGVS